MLDRLASPLVTQELARSPAVAIVGPRQCGKTTLARALGGRYFDLESAEHRARLDLEWRELVQGRRLVILDEAQAHPAIFPEIRSAIDEQRKRNGRFLLLGSVSPALMTRVSESLAGRLSLVELTPLLLGELGTRPTVRRHWLMGGFPDGGVLVRRQFPRWQINYLAQLAQRDMPAWGLPAKPETTQRLQRMLAAVHGQSWNASRIGASLGLSHPTVNTYLEYFGGAFMIRLLRPWHANIGKRLVKAPRVYWRDTGLLHAMLGVATEDDLLNQPWVGASWEGYVIEQIIGTLAARGVLFEPFYFRTSDQHEIDLVLRIGTTLHAIEIKLTSRPDERDLRLLDKAADMIGAERRYLVSRAGETVVGDRTASTNLAWMLEHLGRDGDAGMKVPRRRGRSPRRSG